MAFLSIPERIGTDIARWSKAMDCRRLRPPVSHLCRCPRLRRDEARPAVFQYLHLEKQVFPWISPALPLLSPFSAIFNFFWPSASPPFPALSRPFPPDAGLPGNRRQPPRRTQVHSDSRVGKISSGGSSTSAPRAGGSAKMGTGCVVGLPPASHVGGSAIRRNLSTYCFVTRTTCKRQHRFAAGVMNRGAQPAHSPSARAGAPGIGAHSARRWQPRAVNVSLFCFICIGARAVGK